LDGYAASHRAVHELRADDRRWKHTRLRSSKYLNNRIEADHRNVKARLGPMLGFKSLANTNITIAVIQLIRRIRKGQFALGRLRVQGQTAPGIWNAALSA